MRSPEFLHCDVLLTHRCLTVPLPEGVQVAGVPGKAGLKDPSGVL